MSPWQASHVKFLCADSENRFRSTNHPEVSRGISTVTVPAWVEAIQGIHRKRAHKKIKDVLLRKPFLLTRDKFLNDFSCRLMVT
jgi:hypothetical protein